MDQRITPEAIQIQEFIQGQWPHHQVVLEQPLRKLFPEPKNRGLHHIWKYGSADIVVYHKGVIVGVIEPGGSHHFTDDKQIKNDKRKYMLCKTNGVRCIKVANDLFGALSSRQRRKLFGSVIFGKPR